MVHPQANIIRAKKLGVLIRDARQAAGRQRKDCAEALGVSSAVVSAFEHGKKSPSLPQLELLAYYLDIPLKHFWGSQAISEMPAPTDSIDVEAQLHERQEHIGSLIRKSREAAGLSMKELAERAGMPVGRLRSYENGKRQPPLPELESLVSVIGESLQDFMAVEGPVKEWTAQKEAIEHFSELPEELQSFVSKPVNRPYLEIAQRLSEMSVERLRAVAEGLLEITL